MIERYRDGALVRELAAEFTCHRATITERLKSTDVKMRRQAATSFCLFPLICWAFLMMTE